MEPLLGGRRLWPPGRLVPLDATVHQLDGPVGMAGDVGFVSNNDNGVAVGMQPVEQGHDLNAGLGIEISSGLIGQQDGRVVYQGPRNRDPLALASGEFVGAVSYAIAQFDPFQSFPRLLLPL